jgi:2-desacetyl-2-hydroxyethyl bacteriochlorophyllide A dehydrogenase
MLKGSIYGPKDIRVLETAIPEPGPNEVLIKVAYNGLCGSEMAPYYGFATGKPYYLGERNYPILDLGHEGVGYVQALGPDVSQLSVGDRVVNCGGYAQYVLAAADEVVKIPKEIDISDKHAALCKMAQEMAYVLEMIPIGAADAVLVTGMGSAGLLLLEHLREAGCAKIVCTDPNQHRLTTALALGADAAFKADEPHLNEGIRDACSGSPSVAIDTSGQIDALNNCLETVGHGGRIGLFGRPTRDVPKFRLEHVYHKQLSMIGLRCPAETYSTARTLITLKRISRGCIHADTLITHEFLLQNMAKAFETAERSLGIKIVIKAN